ncbi:hypothetical protein [Salipaludibacillus aurantiacus]|uniref:Uncharacterized protein n=1 Tax=Salipaludibacillus aurantiacus TaxID=1601833 RepID=A0A1H9S5V1_9BACI|nr:hypothetical protein [Salipaludibacillus aurantiacus]SER79539.1 hypothetical protein SAMN05518684_1047 [Salipaludibacillus aurantiacus]
MEAEAKEFGMKFILAVISYIVAGIFTGVGFHKLFVYESHNILFEEAKNAYVEGDAYNYIINANYATAYFTLAILFTMIGSTFLIANFLTKRAEKEGCDDDSTADTH